MKIFRFNHFVISAWAEKTPEGWTGLASVSPPIADTWIGSPSGDSLVTDGVHDTEGLAEEAAVAEALDALTAHLESKRR